MGTLGAVSGPSAASASGLHTWSPRTSVNHRQIDQHQGNGASFITASSTKPRVTPNKEDMQFGELNYLLSYRHHVIEPFSQWGPTCRTNERDGCDEGVETRIGDGKMNERGQKNNNKSWGSSMETWKSGRDDPLAAPSLAWVAAPITITHEASRHRDDPILQTDGQDQPWTGSLQEKGTIECIPPLLVVFVIREDRTDPARQSKTSKDI